MFIFNNKNFKDSICEIIAFNDEEFKIAIDKIQKLKEKYYLAGYISYQAKDVFLNKKIKSKTPLLYFNAYKKYEEFDFENFLKKPKDSFLFTKENITKEEYLKNIEKIKDYILQGSTYEVNYTFSNDVFSAEDGFSLFLKLLNNQKTPYCAYIKNKYQEILSFSPELFFEIKNNKITTKPMKGTIRRDGNDEKEIEFLKNDIKNRAENTMIVDLIRNDLSKIKKSSNIQVEKLFEIETHKTLHQMTSTISADLEEIDIYDILSCLFPCGSITGAPKISTMEIIDKIENYKRDVYCGFIGYFYKNEAISSVPIRVFEKQAQNLKFTFCQGGAIVHKSNPQEEFEECQTKKLFLGNNIEFSLIETMHLINKNPKSDSVDFYIPLYFEHLKRMKNSADYFGFKFNNDLLNLYKIIQCEIFKSKDFKKEKMIRVLLSKSGEYEIQIKNINLQKSRKIILSNEKVYSKNPFLYHKTTFRPWFEKSYEKIEKDEIFDTIFLNEKDELTQGSRSNILILKNDILSTPSLTCGLLGGVVRGELLKNRKIKEKILHKEDLYSADKIFMVNSIRGITECEFLPENKENQ